MVEIEEAVKQRADIFFLREELLRICEKRDQCRETEESRVQEYKIRVSTDSRNREESLAESE